jgi:Domain of unknown function (DUF222)
VTAGHRGGVGRRGHRARTVAGDHRDPRRAACVGCAAGPAGFRSTPVAHHRPPPAGLPRSRRVATDDEPTAAPPARGELWLRERRDGRLGLEGWLNPEHGSLVRVLIEQLATCHPQRHGVPDTRTVPQRHANALIELCQRARASEEFPTTAGEPPHVTVTIDWEALRTGLGAATLDYGQRISAAAARRIACDCKLIPVMLGGDSEPLDVGRVMRTVPVGIRRALMARDGGCSFPGCDRPPGLCEAHHARHWIDGGETSVQNCCLLCPAHHHQVHQQGWDITIRGGRVEFRPPTIIDPNRQPLTNPLRR